MKMYLIGVLIAGILLSISGFILRGWYGPKQSTTMPTPVVQPTPTPVDPHGCDLQGGWVWCEPKQKCLQLWDEKCEGVVQSTDSGKIIKK